MNNISICIIDDHAIVRLGMRDLLEKLGGFEVVLEFESGQQFLDALPLATQPDVFILDYSMPNLNGIEVLKEIEKRQEEYKVLLLTQHFDENIINEAYCYGARGFLNKNCSAHDLKFSLENIVKLGFNNFTDILKRMREYDFVEDSPMDLTLSSRELQFLTLVCSEKEHTYEKIAEIMGVSKQSINLYRTSLFDRYKIKTKV